ncbi:MAG: HEPN domain-containing protein [Nitrosopumilaceae archaeon]|nr:HEPN domain-containing protein [Nitrosopumilaceae archaeon]
MDFPYIHDLDRLRNSLPEGWPVKKTHSSPTRLTEFVTVSRYPGDWPELTGADASYALSVARSICDSVGAEFGRRGVP